MGKYENNTPVKKKRTPREKPASNNKKLIVLIVILSLILAALLAIFVVPQLLFRLSGGESDFEETSSESAEATEETATQVIYSAEDALVFPYALENGKLEIEDLFPYSGINPDGEYQDVTNVVAIVLKNTSDQYLDEAVITATLQNGEECVLHVTDVPAGKKVMTFASGNEVLSPDGFFIDIACNASFSVEETWDHLSVSVVDTTVTLQNNSDVDLTNIGVYCHDVFDESYFSGITYKHMITELPANQSTSIDITESLLGVIEVVRIDTNTLK